MAIVDPTYAAWLKSEALFAEATVPGAVAAWGDKALDSSLISPLAYSVDAQGEATAQADFLKGPIAGDKIVVKGARKDLIGKVITVRGDRLGYEVGGGAVVFVLGAAEAETGATTTLTVLQRLYA